MIFENNKSYKHTTGEIITIVGTVNSYAYGDNTLIAEDPQGNFKPVGKGESYTENYKEIKIIRKIKKVKKRRY